MKIGVLQAIEMAIPAFVIEEAIATPSWEKVLVGVSDRSLKTQILGQVMSLDVGLMSALS